MIYWAGLGRGSVLRAITDMGSQAPENWLKASHHSFPGIGARTSGVSL